MFFFLSKIFAFLFAPVIWVIALLLFAVFSRQGNRRRKFLVSSLIVLLFFSNSFILDEAMRCWEIPAKNYSAIDSTYDVGIVLCGMITYDIKLNRNQFKRQSDRIIQAIELYHSGKIKKFLITGGSGAISGLKI